MTSAATNIAVALADGEARLRAAGLDAARLEAEVLLARRLGVGRGGLLGRFDSILDSAVLDGYRADIDRRASRYPLQYITGEQEFYSLDFMVDERVLIPRSETEMIVDEVIRLAGGRPSGSWEGAAGPAADPGDPTIVDVGTGSGCIAVALAVHLPSALVWATDLSDGALEVARANAQRHDVGGRVQFVLGNGLAAVEAADPDDGRLARASEARGISRAPAASPAGNRDGGDARQYQRSEDRSAARPADLRVDYVVSNPPYIPEAELAHLQPELAHEPRIALSPGPDGLEFTTGLIGGAAEILKPGGWLLIELGVGQSEAAERLLDPELWQQIETKRDLQSIPRILMARRAPLAGRGTRA